MTARGPIGSHVHAGKNTSTSDKSQEGALTLSTLFGSL